MHGRLRILPFIILVFILVLSYYSIVGFYDVISTYGAELKSTVHIIFFGLMGLSILSLCIIFFTGNFLSKSLRNFFFAFVFINLFSLIVFDLVLVVDDLLRFFSWIFGGEGNRSAMLVSIGLILSAIPAVLFILGMIFGPYRYKVHQTTINLKKLPEAFDGLRIVQISDIHSGSFYNKKAVNRGVDLLLAQEPDIVFFTGDLVNDDATEMDAYKTTFSRVQAPMGVYSILGNHDYGDYVQWPSKEAKQENLKNLKAVHCEIGWRLLLNEHVYLERENQKIGLIGVENWGKGFHQVGDLAKAYDGCTADVKLLLSHDPTHWDEQVTNDCRDIDVTFSGHTHGAQMGIEIGKFKWSPIKLRYKKWAGLYQLEDQFLYINRGFGFLGYPGRLGIWPEISVITLKK